MVVSDCTCTGSRINRHDIIIQGTQQHQSHQLCHHMWYSETCSCDHLYSETTSIQGPLGCVPIVALQYIFTSIKRPPLFYFWPKRGHLIQVSLYSETCIKRPHLSTWALKKWSLNRGGLLIEVKMHGKATIGTRLSDP